ncbi:FMN-dependent NADH-azoreductase [Alterisphingorhabdus coralli]|uniref:FMN dependent NADH:quinone oxidoreductase n=1 Tax=Alterisphingorhabdus coralli TaxID=3071408 RepID=A0AA97I0Q6_9SPHN|nr:NAD(P)H-dependent oxidoreductase [Parasphingorhabdus sp. SCSIO 66989]WOE75934.1 NAD(P)H-dependent oxidoreductase [Parasphingorhabdus sp. SCSIO 66989]
MTILHIDSSALTDGSSSRKMTRAIVDQLAHHEVIYRDVAKGLPFVTEDWVGANFTDDADRSEAQKEVLALSDSLIDELERADTIVIGAPMYNFGIAASLKAWIDLIARARKTFRYTETGPEGLLKGKKAYIAISSGGTEIGSAIDYNSSYLKHIMAFLGIEDVTIVTAAQQMMLGEEPLKQAMENIAAM